jgi:alpha-tubulin suppressor-like RCC1 family protein
VTAVAAGADHSLALTSTGQVLAWGYNTDGQLGDGNSSGPSTCGGKPCSTKPVKVQLPKGTKVIRVAAGADHSLALTSTHEVLAWGNNFYGELGNGTSAGPTICFSGQACATTPIKVHFTKGTKVTAVAAGASHSLALTSAGEVLAWGENSDGELGDGTSAGPGACNADDPCSTEPVKVKVPKGSKVVAVGLGDRFSLALTSTGGVLAWGRNFYGQLGDGTFTGPQKCFFGQACSKTPVKVRLPQAAKVVALAAGATHALALTSTGGVLAWGDNFYGELGVGTFTGPHKCDGGEPCSTKPLKVKLPTGDKANAVRAGSFAYHSLALVHHT